MYIIGYPYLSSMSFWKFHLPHPRSHSFTFSFALSISLSFELISIQYYYHINIITINLITKERIPFNIFININYNSFIIVYNLPLLEQFTSPLEFFHTPFLINLQMIIPIILTKTKLRGSRIPSDLWLLSYTDIRFEGIEFSPSSFWSFSKIRNSLLTFTLLLDSLMSFKKFLLFVAGQFLLLLENVFPFQ